MIKIMIKNMKKIMKKILRKNIRRISYCVIAVVAAVVMSSCAQAPVRSVMPRATNSVCTPTAAYPRVVDYDVRYNTTHVGGPGETLWRIAKMYDVSIDDIMRANNLTDRSKLDMGQRLVIPAAAPMKPVIPLYETTKWKYIVIHHSATDEGNALAFYASHLKRGWQNLGYHFVIDNGSSGKVDGQIEVSPRWIKQMDGAHCKADSKNTDGIGICLVGNFSKERVTERQMQSLVYLIDTLRQRYNIPAKNIMGHGEVKGAQTECPGKNFPWKEFYRRLQ